MSNNGIGGYGEADWAFIATPAGPEAIANAVETHVSLLVLGREQLTRVSHRSLVDVAKANRGLQKLDISGNNFCAAGAISLAHALNDNKVMTELNIAQNSLGRVSKFGRANMKGVGAIVDIVRTMRALKVLDISQNRISGLREAHEIKKLCLSKEISGRF